jgi:3-hydroxybutyryl-CoA dehydrogenase
MKVGIIGAGTMGSGIAQLALQNGHEVVLADVNQTAIITAKSLHKAALNRLLDKGVITVEQSLEMIAGMHYTTSMSDLKECGLVIEAIVEDLQAKHKLFSQLQSIVNENCILASNTSSLSITAIGSVLKRPDRVIGMHFFNPAPLMPLVEIIPALQTSKHTLEIVKELILSSKKTGVICKDTPGFIVNRVARPFYGEALRIYEEGLADFATIDWAMTHVGGFKMGPFMLMDFIGNDVNYAVTESVFRAFYFDPRFKPSLTQKRHVEAGFYGRKSGRGYYMYTEGVEPPMPTKDEELGRIIFNRILVMMINEAVDAVFLKVASPEDLDLAMMKGVNYPKGLLKWADEIGLENVLLQLEDLFAEYGEDRYRPNPLLRKMVREDRAFF